MPTLTIFGSATPQPGTPEYEMARALGAAAARAGWTICNGGYGGTMTASAEGARSVGGATVGVTCTALGRPGPNRWIERVIETDTLLQRLEQLVARGDAYVALPGATGTLLEIALVWELQAKQLLPVRPLLLLGDVWRELVTLLPQVSLRPQLVDDVAQAGEVLGFRLRPES